MKYVLVDKGDNIVSTIDLASNVGISGAKTYFVGVKRIDPKEFDKLWTTRMLLFRLLDRYYAEMREERRLGREPRRLDF